jgi:hypothetical protein
VSRLRIKNVLGPSVLALLQTARSEALENQGILDGDDSDRAWRIVERAHNHRLIVQIISWIAEHPELILP